MSRNLAAVFAALLLCLGASRAAPLEAYGRLPSLSRIALSPDGTKIAYERSNATRRVVVVQTLGERQPLAVLDVGDQKLRALQWADNRRLLITMSTTTLPEGFIGHQAEFFVGQWFDVDTKSFHKLFDLVPETSLNAIAGAPKPRIIDGDTVVFVRGVYFGGRETQYALYRIDLTTSVARMVSSRYDAKAEDWVIDAAGHIVAAVDYDNETKHWKLNVYRDGEPSQAIDVAAPIEGPEVEGLTTDGSAVVVGLPPTEKDTTYEQISLKDGKVNPWQHEGVDFGDVWSDLKSDRVIGGSRTYDKHDYVFFDPHAETVWLTIKAAFHDATDVALVSYSDDWSKVVVRAFGPKYGNTYFLIDLAGHKAETIGPAYDGVGDVAPETWIEYKAADGRTIHAYLTLPLNREAKNLPLIVLPHGGPHDRDEPGFDWLSQAIASRGYAVLQPEFRGSDGLGKDLLDAGFGEFGKKMQTDLSDGVSALATQGLIDPKRVCIFGLSYGGYAALAGATLQSGIYRCAVSVAGLSDLKAQLLYWGWPNGSSDDRNQRFWDRFLGIKNPDDPKLNAISPVKHVANVSVPILLIHGMDDTVVPISESEEMADALKAANKPFQFVKLKGEGHQLLNPDTRLQMLQATVKFLEANNPPN